jgi:hypothetical protein
VHGNNQLQSAINYRGAFFGTFPLAFGCQNICQQKLVKACAAERVMASASPFNSSPSAQYSLFSSASRHSRACSIEVQEFLIGTVFVAVLSGIAFLVAIITVDPPPPEIAAQLLFFSLQLYAEKPLLTSMLILVPRILQRRWTRLSRFILEIGVYPRILIPAMHRSILTIPVVLLYIPPHVRHLGPPRLDTAPSTSNRYLHWQHAAFVRGLPAAP